MAPQQYFTAANKKIFSASPSDSGLFSDLGSFLGCCLMCRICSDLRLSPRFAGVVQLFVATYYSYYVMYASLLPERCI